MRSLRIWTIILLLVIIASTGFAQRGQQLRYGRGGNGHLVHLGNPLTIDGTLYLVSDGDTVRIDPGTELNILQVNVNGTTMFSVDTTGIVYLASNLQMANDVYLQAYNNADDAWLDMIKINASDELVTGSDLVMGLLDIVPGSNIALANMDTLTQAGGSVALGELSYQFKVGNSGLIEIYTAYDGAGAFDSSRVDINTILHVTGDIRNNGTSHFTDIYNVGKYISTPPTDSLYLAAETIISTHELEFIGGSGGAVTMTSTPTIVAGVAAGQVIELIGLDDANTITLQDETTVAGTTLEMAGDVSFALGINDVISFRWTGAAWVERYRSDNDND